MKQLSSLSSTVPMLGESMCSTNCVKAPSVRLDSLNKPNRVTNHCEAEATKNRPGASNTESSTR
jgi:hypothetical protein